jgi:splicing factor 3A subunit 3
VKPALSEFEEQWRETGGALGWEAKEAEKSWVDSSKDGSSDGIDLSKFKSAQELEKHIGGDALKTELSRLGLKCGGTIADRAKRLFMTKDTPLDELPNKLFAKGGKENGNSHSSIGERRVDLARQEVVVMALLDQLRPTLEATIRRAERRQTQTLNERERELEEEIHGSTLSDEAIKTGEEDSDEEEEVIYNPKGVPLGWDGKPIPYWLFKLHGLNHFYPCEICGGESYRGRRNFEKHFAESKHAYGMKCLGIPNTKHFHGVTKIEDAQELWMTLQKDLEEDQFDGATQEEYEDSHGNVLSRTTYEDLARQGLL